MWKVLILTAVVANKALAQEAKSCGGIENAVPGCSIDCVKKCSNYWRRDVQTCTGKQCQRGGYACDDGLVFDENRNKCVNYWECSPICGQNEKFSTCANGGCFGARNCTEDPNKDVICVKMRPEDCKIGCVCTDGYVRNKNNVCVKKTECSENERCTGENEFYDPCPRNCVPQTCDTIGKIFNCPIQPAVCRGGCRCAKGFYRNKEGTCIQEKFCPQSCPENEVWKGCANGGCFGPRACSEIGGGIKCVRLIEGACRGACICKDNLLRNANGTCVQPSQCPARPA